MPKKVISTPKAPKAIGPYSQAIQIRDMLFISGQLPFDPETGKLVVGDIKQQVKKIFRKCRSYS